MLSEITCNRNCTASLPQKVEWMMKRQSLKLAALVGVAHPVERNNITYRPILEHFLACMHTFYLCFSRFNCIIEKRKRRIITLKKTTLVYRWSCCWQWMCMVSDIIYAAIEHWDQKTSQIYIKLLFTSSGSSHTTASIREIVNKATEKTQKIQNV